MSILSKIKPITTFHYDGCYYKKGTNGEVEYACLEMPNYKALPKLDFYRKTVQKQIDLIKFFKDHTSEIKEKVRNSNVVCKNPQTLVNSFKQEGLFSDYIIELGEYTISMLDNDKNGKPDSISIESKNSGFESIAFNAPKKEFEDFIISLFTVGVSECRSSKPITLQSTRSKMIEGMEFLFKIFDDTLNH